MRKLLLLTPAAFLVMAAAGCSSSGGAAQDQGAPPAQTSDKASGPHPAAAPSMSRPPGNGTILEPGSKIKGGD